MAFMKTPYPGKKLAAAKGKVRRFCLTGTPVKNCPLEPESIMSMMKTSLLHRHLFHTIHCAEFLMLPVGAMVAGSMMLPATVMPRPWNM